MEGGLEVAVGHHVHTGPQPNLLGSSGQGQSRCHRAAASSRPVVARILGRVVDLAQGIGAATAHDFEPGASVSESTETCSVTVGHVGEVNVCGADGIGTVGSVRQRVARSVEIVGDCCRVEGQVASAEFVLGRVGIEIPLLFRTQRCTIEGISTSPRIQRMCS